MSIQTFLADLSAKGIKLWAEGGNLRYQAPEGVLSQPLLETIAERKGEILAHIKTNGDSRDLQQILMKIFAEILGVEHIDIDDNFFAMGGDSLRAVQLARKLEEQFPEKAISTTEVFEFLTVRNLVDYLSRSSDEGATFQQSHERAGVRNLAARRRRSKRETPNPL